MRQIVSNEMDQIPGEVLSYEDLWRMTLENYHAGSGCLAKSVQDVTDQDKELSWVNISKSLDIICPFAQYYVADIIQ